MPPVVAVEIAFANNPLDTSPTWTDVSSYVLSFWARRGRQQELGRFEAGTAGIRLDNSDRRFDPTNTSSPYFPNVLPTRPIRIRATYSGVTYDLFRGTIDSWPLSWDDPLNGEIEVPQTDAFRYFASCTTWGTVSDNYSSAAIKNILISVDWPASWENITVDVNQTMVQQFGSGNVMSIFQDIADAEAGALFIDGQGRVTLQDRMHRLTNATSTTPIATFGAGAGELPYRLGDPPAIDDARIYNDVRITPTGGTAEIVADSGSQAAYYRRTWEKTLPIADHIVRGATAQQEALALAQWRLYSDKDPSLRFRSIVVSGHADAAIWPIQLGAEISDRLRIRWQPPLGGALIERDCYIEAVAHRSTGGGSWETTFQLSPADVTPWWIFDSAIFDTSRLAY